MRGTRAERVKVLSEGEPEESVRGAHGQTLKLPARNAYAPNALMSAALDWAEDGYVTSGTVARLKAEGYDPSSLRIPISKPQKNRRLGDTGEGESG